MKTGMLVGLALAIATQTVRAAGDFPLASCKGWNGTVVDRSGIDSPIAMMSGVITKADIQEYCERDPGGETRAHGGKLTTAACVDKYFRAESRSKLIASANCTARTIVYKYNGKPSRSLRLPEDVTDDSSCASGAPPLIEQFKMLCPAAAARMKLQQ